MQTTPHNGRTSEGLTLTPVRVVYQNTLTVALEIGAAIARAHHTRGLNRQLDAARGQVRQLMAGLEAMVRRYWPAPTRARTVWHCAHSNAMKPA